MSGEHLGPRLEALRAAVDPTGRSPLALLDIDLTLVENAERNRAIWRDWMRSMIGRWPGAERAAEQAATMPIVFGVQQNMETLGVREPELQREGFKFWLEAFFSDDYARLDTALDGAVEAVRRLTASRITIAYVTARPEKMTPVTVECLARLGFPIGVPGTILVTRPESAGSDEEAKALAYGWLASLGTPILSADNEPGHVNATLRRFPEALNVLVDTRHSPGAPDLAAEALRLPRLLDAILL